MWFWRGYGFTAAVWWYVFLDWWLSRDCAVSKGSLYCALALSRALSHTLVAEIFLILDTHGLHTYVLHWLLPIKMVLVSIHLGRHWDFTRRLLHRKASPIVQFIDFSSFSSAVIACVTFERPDFLPFNYLRYIKLVLFDVCLRNFNFIEIPIDFLGRNLIIVFIWMSSPTSILLNTHFRPILRHLWLWLITSSVEIIHTWMLLGRIAIARIHAHLRMHHRMLILVRVLMMVEPRHHHLLGVVVHLLRLLLLLISLLIILLVIL